MSITRLADNYAVSPQIEAADIAAIAAEGFVAVICNRPDDEEPGQPRATEIAVACDRFGIRFHHLPFAQLPIPDALSKAHRDVVDGSDGPVLGYCRSGQRSILIWQQGGGIKP